MHPFLPVISRSPFFSWSFTGSRENFSPQLLEEYVEIRVSPGRGREPRPDGTLPAGSSWPSAAVLVHLERFWPCYSALHLPSCPGALWAPSEPCWRLPAPPPGLIRGFSYTGVRTPFSCASASVRVGNISELILWRATR